MKMARCSVKTNSVPLFLHLIILYLLGSVGGTSLKELECLGSHVRLYFVVRQCKRNHAHGIRANLILLINEVETIGSKIRSMGGQWDDALVDEEELQGFVLGNLLPLGVDVGGHTVKQQRLDGIKLSGIDSSAEHTARRLEDVDIVGHGRTMGASAIRILVYAIGDITLVLGGKVTSHIVRTLELGGSAIGRLHGAHRVNIELAIEIDQRLAIGKVSAVSS